MTTEAVRPERREVDVRPTYKTLSVIMPVFNERATVAEIKSFASIRHLTDEQDVASAAAHLTTHLLASPEAVTLAGAELVVGSGWLGLRTHPRPIGSVTFGGPAVPVWLDDTIKEIVGR